MSDDEDEDIFIEDDKEDTDEDEDIFIGRPETSGGIADELESDEDIILDDEPLSGQFGGVTITDQRKFGDTSYVSTQVLSDITYTGLQQDNGEPVRALKQKWEIARDVIRRVLESLYGKSFQTNKSYAKISSIISKMDNNKLISYNPVLLPLGFHYWSTNTAITKVALTKWKATLKKNELFTKLVALSQLSDADILRYIYITYPLPQGSIAEDCF